MTLKQVSASPAMEEANQLPAYSAVDDSPVLVPRQMTGPGTLSPQGTGARSHSSAAPTYPTAEEEKARLQAQYQNPTEYRAVRSESPASPASPASTYPTAEEEKARLQAQYQNPAEYRDAAVPVPGPETFLPPVEGESLGHASESVLSRGLQVPSNSRFVSSGFPYPEVLGGYHVSAESWNTFTAEITKEASMTASDWAVAVAGGAGTFLVGGIFVSWLAIVPAFFVGRSIHRTREAQNLAKARNVGDLEAKLLKWNEEYFAPRGLLIRLDLPGESYDIGKMDVHEGKRGMASWCHRRRNGCQNQEGVVAADQNMTKEQRKMEKKANKAVKKECRRKSKATKKGRIVILPMNRNGPVPTVAEPENVFADPAPSVRTDLYASSAV
ncbi:MAG: hypothetical protein M1815_005797 [Lichina confinis]|nr:MAG: hypothetical protein M1815_005797 [Lichina confinis]